MNFIKECEQCSVKTVDSKASTINMDSLLENWLSEIGDCCFMFHSIFEQEHALGVVLEKWNVKDVGWGDICFS